MGERAELWAVLAGIGIALIAGAILWYRDKCPKCNRRSWREEIEAERIPGSEHKATTMTDANQGPRTEIRARFRVLYGCRHCGHRFRKTEARTISSSSSGPYYSGSGSYDSSSRRSQPTGATKQGKRLSKKD